MGIRARLFAAVVVLALAPGVALAQDRIPQLKPGSGVVPPPSKPFVGPPVELAGPGPSVPPPAQASGEKSGAEKLSEWAGAADGVVTLLEPVAQDRDLLGSKKNVRTATKALGKVGGAVTAVNVVAGVAVMSQKCQQKEMASECLQVTTSTGAAAADAIQLLPKMTKTPIPGNAIQTVSDGVGVYRNCVESPTIACAQSVIDTAISAGSLVPAVGQGVAAGYSIGKVIAAALVDSVSYALYNKPLYEAYYDLLRAEKDMNDMADKTSSAAIEAHRAKLRARYQHAKTNLEAKQEAYDAERARQEQLRQEQQRAQQQAAATQAVVGGLMGSLQNVQQAYTPHPVSSQPPTSHLKYPCRLGGWGCGPGSPGYMGPDSGPRCIASAEICNQILTGLPPGTTLADYQKGLSASKPTSKPPAPKPPSSGGGCGGTGPGTCQ